MTWQLCLVVVCLLASGGEAIFSAPDRGHKRGSSILLVCPPAAGHVLPLVRLGSELLNQGHRVYFCSTEVRGQNFTWELCESHGIKFISAGLDPMSTSEFRQMTGLARKMSTVRTVFLAQSFMAHTQRVIVNYLDHPSFKQWDITVFDFMLEAGGIYLSEKWGVPVVFNSVTCSFTPMLLPMWPFPVLGTQYADNLSFLQRFYTAVIALPIAYLVKFTTVLQTRLALGYGDYPSISTLMSSGVGVNYPLFVDTVIGFEFARTRLPLVHYVGPLFSTKPGDEHIEDLQILKWLDSAGVHSRGVVIVSMGSIAHLTNDMARIIMTSLQSTNYSVVWSLGASAKQILNGLTFDEHQVLVKEWIPQMAVLGHSSVRMAILHCGLGGIQEALYNAVPIICIPQMFDQRDNGVRVASQGLGVTLDPDRLTVEQLSAAITQVDDAYYKKMVLQMSHMLVAAGGIHKASNLIEHYLEIGYKHLQMLH